MIRSIRLIRAVNVRFLYSAVIVRFMEMRNLPVIQITPQRGTQMHNEWRPLVNIVPVKGFLDTRLLLKNSIMPPFSLLLRSGRVVAGPVA